MEFSILYNYGPSGRRVNQENGKPKLIEQINCPYKKINSLVGSYPLEFGLKDLSYTAWCT